MAYKQVQDLSADTTISLGGFNKKTRQDNPTQVEGYYLGSRTVEVKGEKSTLHFFQTSKGSVAVWGKTDTNRKLGSAQVGAMTKVTFDKLVPTGKGKEMYKYIVAQDDADTIEVSVSNGDNSSSYADDDGPSSAEAEDGDKSDFTSGVDHAAAERKAKVEALLGKNKKHA